MRLLILGLTLGFALLAQAATSPLVMATNIQEVRVTSGFTGENVLVYGAISGPGQVIVVLRSPDSTEAMQKKTRSGPIWLNGAKVTVTGAPGIWQRLSSAPVRELLPEMVLQQQGLTRSSLLSHTHFAPQPESLHLWQQAFLKQKTRHQQYRVVPTGVKIREGLFTASIQLPAALPLGHYQLTTYLVRQQQIVAVDKEQIDVRQVGFQAWIARFAEQHAWLYGVVLTFILAALGFGLGIIMRRRSA
ncbi:hypothetical protein B1757_10045 [Acidithiobacillus marinus]|uniref:TIGR02186 family protein n=1 Tax=Acidithiobacillus marinus TaxID=187490 RepID=A0A2I1DKQ6_9PROT|nr:hypothetical protein B1757_10045 [Acidithiobacillus marinus]